MCLDYCQSLLGGGNYAYKKVSIWQLLHLYQGFLQFVGSRLYTQGVIPMYLHTRYTFANQLLKFTLHQTHSLSRQASAAFSGFFSTTSTVYSGGQFWLFKQRTLYPAGDFFYFFISG